MIFRRRTTPDYSAQLLAIREELDTLKRSEARREAEWLDVLDRFDRLYKRLVARQDRERRSSAGQAESAVPVDARSDAGESTLALRRRLRG